MRPSYIKNEYMEHGMHVCVVEINGEKQETAARDLNKARHMAKQIHVIERLKEAGIAIDSSGIRSC